MPQHRLLISLIVFMGVAIVACLVIIGIELAQRAGNLAADLTVEAIDEVLPAKASSETTPETFTVVSLPEGITDQAITLPEGAAVRQIEMDQGRLAIWLTDGEGQQQIMIVNLGAPETQIRLLLVPDEAAAN